MSYQRSVLLGVVGNSAAGKTTMSAGIAEILGPERVTVICTDDYHRYNRKQRAEMKISALDPECNYIDIMEQHFEQLRQARPILKPIYNHSTGDFDPPEYIEPKPFVILEGLLGYHSKAMRNNFDVRAYLEPEEELRVQWKIKRDTAKRGYTPEQVRASLEKRVDDTKNFIQPQKTHADILVNFYRPPDHQKETGSHLNVRLMLKPTLPHPDVSDLLECGEENKIICSSITRKDDWLMEMLDISGQISDEKAAQVEDLIWTRLLEHNPDLEHLRSDEMGSFLDGTVKRQSHPLALTQLLIAYHMLIAREELNQEIHRRVEWVQSLL